MGAPFITVEDFAAAFRPLKSSEQDLAEWMIKVASDWIWAHKPTIDPTSVAAKVVVIEVVSQALRFGKYGPLRTFQEETSHSTVSGTFADADRFLDFTDRHRELLGIPVRSAPKYAFKAFDY